jgi:hypothetical protein
MRYFINVLFTSRSVFPLKTTFRRKQHFQRIRSDSEQLKRHNQFENAKSNASLKRSRGNDHTYSEQ